MNRKNWSTRNYRLVNTPKRSAPTLEPLTAGLQFLKDAELIDLKALSECEGFLLYEGLLKKDWEASTYSEDAVDNISTVAVVDVPECKIT